jgi:endonuclease/exonuclease/phosphatase (EEP) superfamily protein YafD
LASKYPFLDKDYLWFNIAPEATWSTVYGKFNHPSFGPVNVFCSHLVAGLSLIDFSQENYHESKELLDFVQRKVENTSEIVILAGDYNSVCYKCFAKGLIWL